MTKSLPLRTICHPDRRLQLWWNSAQVGLFLLPMSPLLGGMGLLFALFGTWKERYREIHGRSLNQGFAVLALWLVLTTLFAPDRLSAFLGLFNFLPFFALFVTFSLLIQTPAQMRRMAWIAIATSVPIAVIGWGQLFWGWAGPVKLGLILDWRLDATGAPPGRMASVFEYANVLASYFLMTFILGLGLWCETFQAWRTLKQQPKKPEKIRDPRDPRVVKTIDLSVTGEEGKVGWGLVFLTLALLVNAIALVLTNSRNGWAIASMAGLGFILYLGWRWLLLFVIGALSAVLGSAFGPHPLRQGLQAIVPAYFWMRITDQLYPDRPVATLRKTQWQFAWDLTQTRPITGWGLRSFTELYEAQTQVWMGHPHNLFLMLSAETGIPGMLLLSGLVAWVLAKGILTLKHWSDLPVEGNVEGTASVPGVMTNDRLIFFTYLVTFASCTLFHLFDVTLFDSRVNILGWLILAAIYGVADSRRSAVY
ncbi:O-antigen ligase family protein [Laspinema palackyanum]|uniref:O-antigen ligase family protein n=1 Tax=Laspinema palackyanum TaxID=3231601 RepID=UPI00345D39DA|nr:O-antigen ligase family protein [Laspinema sp. D2c]